METNQPKNNKPTWREFIKTDRAILIFCIGIAFVFWLVTKLSYSYSSSLIIKLNYMTPPDKVFTYSPASHLDVDVRGSGWELLGLFFSDKEPTMEIDATNEDIKKIGISVLRNQITDYVPSSNIVAIRPEYLSIQTEQAATKIVPIALDQQVSLAPLHQYKDSLKIKPNHVEIKGPASVLKDINTWPTTPLIMQNVKKNILVDLSLRRPSNNSITFDVKEVQCIAKVEETTEKEIEVPIKILNAPEGLLLVILPEKITVACRVGLSEYKQISALDFEATIDFATIDLSATEKIPVQLKKYPKTARNINFKPQKVDFIIRQN
jgi:hypothetical protein